MLNMPLWLLILAWCSYHWPFCNRRAVFALHPAELLRSRAVEIEALSVRVQHLWIANLLQVQASRLRADADRLERLRVSAAGWLPNK